MVVNFDQTAVVLWAASKYTYEKKGTRNVKMLTANEKAQVTAVLATSANGDNLPPQIIFAGKTERSLPEQWKTYVSEERAVGVSRWSIVFTENHWSNFETMVIYVRDVLLPYFAKQRQRLGKPENEYAIVLLDCWSVHRQTAFLNLLLANYIIPIFVPGGMTGVLQPQDISVNRPFKNDIRKQFDEWLLSLPLDQHRRAGSLTTLKQQVLAWIDHAWKHVTTRWVR